MKALLGILTLALTLVVAPAQADAQGSIEATHPSLVNAELPPLIPIETFFSTRTEAWDHRVSPDGKRLLWIALDEGFPKVHFRDLDSDVVRVVPAERAVRWAYWAADSRHITGWWDNDGDENYHFLFADTAAADMAFRDATPYPGIRVRFHQWFPDEPMVYLLMNNRRDRSLFDLYRYDFLQGTRELVLKNPGDISGYETDEAGNVIGIYRRLPNTDWVFQVPDGDDWRTVVRGTVEDNFWISGKPPVGQDWAFGVSNIGRDKQVVVRIDLSTGAETVIYEDPEADVTELDIDSETYELAAAWSEPNFPKMKVFRKDIQAVVDQFAGEGTHWLSFQSRSRDLSVVTVKINRDRMGDTFHLVDLPRSEVTQLAAPRIAALAEHLSPVVPVHFPARDGLTLNGYLTIPNGTDGKNLPMVLAVHGGPFWRDSWGYYDYDQLMANRGYAVLRVNYRGSTGYGRSFIARAEKEFGGAMQTDLIDGVNWAIDNGIADPTKIAIYGRSFGGYATLLGLTFTPEVFAAGINVVGVADLELAMEKFPPYWRNWMGRWHKYLGRLESPVDRAHMRERSPIHYVDRIVKPMLVVHGANDVRVTRDHSDLIVASARSNGVDVQYIVFEDEGHAIRRWSNRMELAHAIEAFLATHLGGRSGGTRN